MNVIYEPAYWIRLVFSKLLKKFLRSLFGYGFLITMQSGPFRALFYSLDLKWRLCAQHNDMEHNDTHNNDAQNNCIQYNDTKQIDIQHNYNQHNGKNFLCLSVIHANCYLCLLSQIIPLCWVSLCGMAWHLLNYRENIVRSLGSCNAPSE